MRTTVCHKHGCYCTAVEGKHYCMRHINLEERWGKRPAPERKRSRAWHPLYSREEWKRGRAEFLEENPVCAVCGRPAEIVDHIVPHRGSELLFFERDNWQPLCRSCHGAKTMRENGWLKGDRGVKNISEPGDDQQPPSFVRMCEMGQMAPGGGNGR